MKLDDLYTADIHEEGTEVRILDRSGNETNLYIKVKGVDSPSFRKWSKSHSKKRLEALRQSKDFDEDASITQGLLDCTIGGRGVEEKFSKKLCAELYEKAPYIKDQVDIFMGEAENFTKAKPKK